MPREYTDSHFHQHAEQSGSMNVADLPQLQQSLLSIGRAMPAPAPYKTLWESSPGILAALGDDHPLCRVINERKKEQEAAARANVSNSSGPLNEEEMRTLMELSQRFVKQTKVE